jgi:hypothetical protein
VQDTSQIFAPLAVEPRPHSACLVPPRTLPQKFAFLREYDFALIAPIGLVLLLFFYLSVGAHFNRRNIVNQHPRGAIPLIGRTGFTVAGVPLPTRGAIAGEAKLRALRQVATSERLPPSSRREANRGLISSALLSSLVARS